MSVSVDGSSVALHYRSGTGKLALMNELVVQTERVVTDWQKSDCDSYGHPHTNKDESLSPTVTSLFSIDTLRSVTTALCVLRPFLLALILPGRPISLVLIH